MDVEKNYRDKIMTAQEAVNRFVKSGDRVFLGGLVIAADILNVIIQKTLSGELCNICLDGNMILNELELLNPELTEDKIRYKSFFHGAFERSYAKTGTASFVPMQFCNLKRYTEKLKPQVVAIPVSPPDEKGNLNIGPFAPYTPAAIECGKLLIGQVNRHLPKVYGMGVDVPIERFSALVEADKEIPEYSTKPATKIDNTIAGYILEHVPDGACIQLGIGAMPNAVGYGLKHKKHLGIHTEMLTESMAELIRCGAVDNSRKRLHKDVTLAAFTLGSQAHYDFVDNNEKLYFAPYEYSNNPAIIAQNDNVISINNALSIDLMGQACAEAIGFSQYSGTGGQVDFVRGALYSKGGKSFIAASSLIETKNGKQSRIVLNLAPGAAVTTLRSETQYVVTEYGCVHIWGDDIPTRARKLISIAHPDFREQLAYDAKKAGLLY